MKDRILTHVEQTEYVKELARLEVVRLLESAQIEDLADDPDAIIEALLAAILVRLGNHTEDLTTEARDYAVALGLKRLADEEVAAAREDAHDRFLAFAAPALLAAAGPARTQIEQMLAAGVAPETIRAALATEATRTALFAQFEAALKGSSAAYVQDLTRTVVNTALESSDDKEFEWIAVMDGNTCDDVFDNSCAPRHGEVMALSDWNDAGRPGAPQLICSIYAKAGSNCRCQLAAANHVSPKLLNPVRVTDAIRAGKERAAVYVERR